MDRSSILVAEDDKSSNYFVRRFLENKNYDVHSCMDGEEAIRLTRKQDFDLAIIDLFLPKFNGITVLRRIRDKVVDCPVIIMTDTHSEENEIETYKSGANLIHNKPINYKILEAQINNLIKQKSKENFLEIGDIYLNPKHRMCIKNNKEIYLTYNEFNLAYLLFSNKDKIFSREEVLSKVLDDSVTLGAVDTLVSRLRSKLGNYKDKGVIETVIKSGFRVSLEYSQSKNI